VAKPVLLKDCSLQCHLFLSYKKLSVFKNKKKTTQRRRVAEQKAPKKKRGFLLFGSCMDGEAELLKALL
jgi:hypothetical protein